MQNKYTYSYLLSFRGVDRKRYICDDFLNTKLNVLNITLINESNYVLYGKSQKIFEGLVYSDKLIK